MVTIQIKRYRLANLGPDGYRPGYAWKYSYIVEFPESLPELGQATSDQGTSLKSAEAWAKRFCARKYGKANFNLVRVWE